MVNVVALRNGVSGVSVYIDSDASMADLRAKVVTAMIRRGLIKPDREYDLRTFHGLRPEPDQQVKRYRPLGEDYLPLIVEVVEC